MIKNIRIIQRESFYIVGISVRTTNQNGQSQKDIGNLWNRFMKDTVQQQIPDKISDDIYCVYTGYESDYTGPYTAIIGCKVEKLNQLPAELVSITIPEGKYRENTLSGKFPDKVHAAWLQIWNSKIDRKYTADYDLYTSGAKNFEETEVRIYLAV